MDCCIISQGLESRGDFTCFSYCFVLKLHFLLNKFDFQIFEFQIVAVHFRPFLYTMYTEFSVCLASKLLIGFNCKLRFDDISSLTINETTIDESQIINFSHYDIEIL
jgi:hypothetical protein